MPALGALTKRVKAALWPRLAARLPWNSQVSYSQFGEDMILAWLFRGKRGTGFYVDIGAFHPVACSNTYALYCRGWRGVCVEPRPDVADEFRIYRPRDVILEAAVTPQPAEMVEFFLFDEPTLNTADPAEAGRTVACGRKLLARRSVPAKTLTQVFDLAAPLGDRIDVLSIDVEGLDEAVLRSNDWARHRPAVIVFESRGASYQEVAGLPLVETIGHEGYELVTKCGESVIVRHPQVWRDSMAAG